MSVALFLVVFPLLVPGHLDGFELAFVRFGRIVAEAVELGDPLEQVGEAHLERILLGELVVEGQGDVFGWSQVRACISDLGSFQGAADGGVHHVFGQSVGGVVQHGRCGRANQQVIVVMVDQQELVDGVELISARSSSVSSM